ncbi:MAG: sensor histidine kinase [Steroidobacteraceae bacterium]
MNEVVTVGRLRADTGAPAGARRADAERPSLGEPLPADVFSGSAGLLMGYRNYPVFSAPWFWRRTAIFAPVAAAVGLAEAVLLALLLSDVRLGLLCAAVAIPIWVVFVTTGPAFAAMVRHLRSPQHIERVAIIGAVLAGLAVSIAGQHVAEIFSRAAVVPRYAAYFGIPRLQLLHSPDAVFVAVMRTVQASLFLCLGGGLALPAYFREQRLWSEARHERELAAVRRDKTEADLRLTVLQAQVEPHFLFNTLASIHSLIRKDPDRAEATLEALAAHLRATLPRLRADIGSAHSTLDQQIDICESYLALMQVRLGGRLRYTVDVPPPLRCHPFPPLMLISLVENAIKHGIEPSDHGGNVVVSAEVEAHAGGPRLAVSVVDDGVGLRSEVGGGMGLRNIREQLAARFGSQGTLIVRGRTIGGVSATIRFPYADAKA